MIDPQVKQVTARLFYQLSKPEIGDEFIVASGHYRVVGVEHANEGEGWVFVVRPVDKDAPLQ